MHDVWREMADRLALRYGMVPRDLWRLLAAQAVLEMTHELGGAGQREREVMRAIITVLEGEDDIPAEDTRMEVANMAMTAVDVMYDAARWVKSRHCSAVDAALDAAYRHVRKSVYGEG